MKKNYWLLFITIGIYLNANSFSNESIAFKNVFVDEQVKEIGSYISNQKVESQLFNISSAAR